MTCAPDTIWKDNKTGDVWDALEDPSSTDGLTEYRRADLLPTRAQIEQIFDDEIKVAREWGPGHIPIIQSLKEDVLGVLLLPEDGGECQALEGPTRAQLEAMVKPLEFKAHGALEYRAKAIHGRYEISIEYDDEGGGMVYRVYYGDSAKSIGDMLCLDDAKYIADEHNRSRILSALNLTQEGGE